MDGSQFDNLSRLVTSRLSRRAGLGLFAVAGLFHAIDGAAAAGGKTGLRKGHGKKKPRRTTICYQGRTMSVSTRGWQRHHRGASRGPCSASGECAGCSPDMCFVTVKNSQAEPPQGYACCPPDKLCRSPLTDGSVPDQCCYDDEVCDPDRVNPASPRFDALAEGVCCRSCNGGCCFSHEHCIDGPEGQPICDGIGTARLPRHRRP